jgi:hypothetical protein
MAKVIDAPDRLHVPHDERAIYVFIGSAGRPSFSDFTGFQASLTLPNSSVPVGDWEDTITTASVLADRLGLGTVYVVGRSDA